MPENSSKTQSKATDQKPVKVESVSSNPQSKKPEKSENAKKATPKTKSRLPNKSLTDSEVAKKKAKIAKESKKVEKPNSKPEKSETKKVEPKKSEKATAGTKTKKTEDTPEVITVKTKPKAESSKASAADTRKTTVKVIKAPNAPKNKPSTKPASGIKPQAARSQKPTSKPVAKPEVKPEAKQPAAQKAKVSKNPSTKTKKSNKAQNSKNFSFLTVFSKVVAIILGFSSLFFIGMLIHLDVLPAHYLLLAIALIIIITSGFSLLLVHQKTGAAVKAPVNVLSIIFSCVYLVGGGYIAETSGFLDSLKPQEYISEQYYLIVKNDSDLQDVKELKDKTVGTFDEGIDLYQDAVKKLNNTVSVELESVKSVHALTENLLSGEFNAVFLSSIHKSIVDEDSAEFGENTRILYIIEAKVKADAVEEPKVNVTSEPFTIYISGNDSYGDLTARGLSDVNMLATVNPVTHEVLLTSIPRDCYVQLHDTTGLKDKLTHAGLYGVQMSILTIEDLLNIDIDYYVKINFPALVSLVDAIGGIDVYSDKTFKPFNGDGRLIYEGMNHFDGKLALAFARERMAYTYGDRHRVQNQRDVLNAIIQKISSSTAILTKTNEILSSISKNLDTNISKSEISSLVKLQLSSMPSWQIAEYMVNGSDLHADTYTFSGELRYVMPPSPESIQTAHDYITGIMEGRTIEELKIPAPEKSWK